MRINPRRRVHSNHSEYHNDIILIPTSQECRDLDPLLRKWEPQRVIESDGLIQTMEAEVRVDDAFNLYIILKPKTEDI